MKKPYRAPLRAGWSWVRVGGKDRLRAPNGDLYAICTARQRSDLIVDLSGTGAGHARVKLIRRKE